MVPLEREGGQAQFIAHEPPRLDRGHAAVEQRLLYLGVPPVALGLGDPPDAVAVDSQPALDRPRPDAVGDLGPHQADHRALVLTNAVAWGRLARPHRLAELQQQVEWNVRLLGHLFERVLGGRGEPLVQREVVEVERQLV